MRCTWGVVLADVLCYPYLRAAGTGGGCVEVEIEVEIGQTKGLRVDKGAERCNYGRKQ